MIDLKKKKRIQIIEMSLSSDPEVLPKATFLVYPSFSYLYVCSSFNHILDDSGMKLSF